MKIKNKGFSLVELLVAIAIIGLISGVAGYFIITTINNSKEKSNKIAINNMKTSANTYIKEYYDEVVWKVNGTNNLNESCISIQTLVSKGYLSKNVLEESETQKSIILTKDDNNTIIKETIIDTDCDSYEQIVDIPTKKDICNDLSYNGSRQQLYDYERLISTGNYKTIKYKDTQYNETNLPINAGEYDVEFELEDGKVWKDNTRGIKRVTCTMKKASPELSLVPNGNSDENIGSSKTKLNSKTSGTISIKSSNKEHATAKVVDKNIIAGIDKEIEIITLSSRKTPTYITIKVTPNDPNYKNEEITYTVGKVENKKINKPSCLNPYFNKEEQNLIKKEESYILYNNEQTGIGTYQVTAKLNYGYTWSDGTTNDEVITCEIKRPTPTITYINNSGSGCSNKTVTYGETYGELCTPTRTGYTFQGWYSDSNLTNEINSESQVVNIYNHNLYAKWTPITYTVSYSCNGGTGSTSSSSHTYGSAKNLTSNGCSRTGYSFNGWNTNSSGTGTNYSNAQSVSNLTSTNGGTVTLYAKWQANTYTITYDNNGGSGGPGSQNFVFNSGAKISSTKPTRTGYNFVNWTYSGHTFNPGDSIPTGWGSFTLTAQWKQSTVVTVNHQNYIICPDDQNKPTREKCVNGKYNSMHVNAVSVSGTTVTANIRLHVNNSTVTWAGSNNSRTLCLADTSNNCKINLHSFTINNGWATAGSDHVNQNFTFDVKDLPAGSYRLIVTGGSTKYRFTTNYVQNTITITK